jgi:hypothetical protein
VGTQVTNLCGGTDGLSDGAIIGIAVGGFVGVGIVTGVLAVICLKRARQRANIKAMEASKQSTANELEVMRQQMVRASAN